MSKNYLNLYNTKISTFFYVTTTNKKLISNKEVSKETLLTPRFYTTDFKEISELDISSNQAEIEAIVEEFRIDYNRDHFIRDKEFLNSWESFR